MDTCFGHKTTKPSKLSPLLLILMFASFAEGTNRITADHLLPLLNKSMFLIKNYTEANDGGLAFKFDAQYHIFFIGIDTNVISREQDIVIVISDNMIPVINKTIPFEKGDHRFSIVGEYNSIVGNAMAVKGAPNTTRYSISVYGMKVTSLTVTLHRSSYTQVRCYMFSDRNETLNTTMPLKETFIVPDVDRGKDVVFTLEENICPNITMNLTVSNEINGYTITERMQNRPSCNFKIKRMLHFSVVVTTNLTSERSDLPLEITIEQFFAFNISGIRPGYRDLFLVPGKSLTNFSYVSVIAPLKTNWILNQITFYNDQGEIIQSFSHGEKITHQIFIHPQYETMQLLVQVETGETGNEDDIILRLYCTDGIIEDMLGSPIDNFQPNATDNITVSFLICKHVQYISVYRREATSRWFLKTITIYSNGTEMGVFHYDKIVNKEAVMSVNQRLGNSSWYVKFSSEISLLYMIHVCFQGEKAKCCRLFCGINERAQNEAKHENEQVFSFALPTLGHLNVFNFSRYTYKNLSNLPITVEGKRQNYRMFIIGPVSEHYIYINRCDSNLDKEKLITECSRNKLCNLTAFGLQIHFAILMSISGEGIRHVNLIRKSGSLTQMLTYSSLQPTSVVKEVFCPNDDGIKNLQRMLVKCETRCAEAKVNLTFIHYGTIEFYTLKTVHNEDGVCEWAIFSTLEQNTNIDFTRTTPVSHSCLCCKTEPKNLTEEELNEKLKQLEIELIMPRKNTSKYIRSKNSMKDQRESSFFIGSTVLVVVIVPFVSIVLMDFIPLIKWVYTTMFLKI
ncbi:uncharacterized protein LOC118766049 [Octopus sinensis]|uniref:Uncharacterized protein LOC118766049 n=1 Tax=Octopus sinensis TaxID=2607531 RepID=A0A7E6FBG1_9MOLL|nr:uncharacterized protein LOC118766049 [Octopus sinensis]